MEESSNLSESILKIQEELSLSTFLLKKTIENLNDDLDELGISEHLKILATGTEVSLEIDGHYSSGFLLSNYIKRSIYLDLLIEFFEKITLPLKFLQMSTISVILQRILSCKS